MQSVLVYVGVGMCLAMVEFECPAVFAMHANLVLGYLLCSQGGDSGEGTVRQCQLILLAV